MKTRICPICVGVSSVWLVLSAGIAFGYLEANIYLVPVALLMGGTVAGIAFRSDSLRWKTLVVLLGMPLAYLAIVHLSKPVVIVEFIVMIIIASLLFVKRTGGKNDGNVRKLEKQMKQCC